VPGGGKVSEQTLKEMLEPPFSCVNGRVFLAPDFFVDIYNDNRGISDPDALYFVLNALKEKYERDFGGLRQWDECFENGWHHLRCPKCNSRFMFDDTDYDYCPHCGKRLLPPEELPKA
jgi:DNA-directed RNA polymerase subunit RPC12/RpoP